MKVKSECHCLCLQLKSFVVISKSLHGTVTSQGRVHGSSLSHSSLPPDDCHLSNISEANLKHQNTHRVARTQSCSYPVLKLLSSAKTVPVRRDCIHNCTTMHEDAEILGWVASSPGHSPPPPPPPPGTRCGGGGCVCVFFYFIK